jgi:hypothetical protein
MSAASVMFTFAKPSLRSVALLLLTRLESSVKSAAVLNVMSFAVQTGACAHKQLIKDIAKINIRLSIEKFSLLLFMYWAKILYCPNNMWKKYVFRQILR